jgi:hypothetical protein
MPFPALHRRLPPAPRWLAPALALCLGVGAMYLYDAAVTGFRYAYSGDSASYLEMAESLRREGEPLVVPWDIRPADRDRILQPLFPPGYALMINALAPLAGSAKVAALWPPRLAAMLLPLALLLAFRGLAPDSALLAVAALVLSSPGILYWHYIAYSDVPCLLLSMVAFGCLLRGEAGGLRRWLFGAGLAAGLAYALRNAALAVLVASAVALGLAAIARPRLVRALPAWLLGALIPVALVKRYDLAHFGRLEPYWMPPSSRPWTQNLADWFGSQLADLHLRAEDARDLNEHLALVIIATLTVAALGLWLRSSNRTPAHRATTVLGLYVGAGVVMLVASRSTFEWGDYIDTRHTMQYSFAILLIVLLYVREFVSLRGQRRLAVAAVVALAWVGWHTVDVVQTERNEVEAWQAIANDRATLQRVAALPPDHLLASNNAVLLRLETGRAVRQLDVGGDDQSLAGSLVELAEAAAGRPADFILICSEWTTRLAVCRNEPPEPSAPRCGVLRRASPALALCAVPTVAGPSAGARRIAAQRNAA